MELNWATISDLVEQGWDTWAAKEHNKKWVRRIDGTPIRNDLSVNIIEAIVLYLKEHR